MNSKNSINLKSVIIATIAAFFIGFLIHGPVAGKLWLRIANINESEAPTFSEMIPKLLWNLVVQFVSAFVLAVIYFFASNSKYIGGEGVKGGMILAGCIWLGFLVPSSAIEVIWMGRNYTLWLFEACSSLIVMLTMGAIIAAGKKSSKTSNYT